MSNWDVQPPPSPTSSDDPRPWDERGSAPNSVLVVDDEPGVRTLFTRVLERAGYRVLVADSGAEGLRLLRAEHRNTRLILLDLMMPEMDGWRFRHEQRADPRLTSIPTVIVTAAPLTDVVHAELNAADYLRKPVSVARLLNVVKRHCTPERT